MILDDNNPSVTSENNLYLDHQLNYHHSEPIIIESYTNYYYVIRIN